MGNKHALAADVAALVDAFPARRPFLDLFCGMCSVGAAVAPSGRPVWGNDVQWSASLVARCLLATPDDPPDHETLAIRLADDYATNLGHLEARFESEMAREAALLAAPELDAFQAEDAAWRHAANDFGVAAEVAMLGRTRTAPYRLFTLSFAWGYFGLRQAAQIDSLRYAIDKAKQRRTLSAGEARWALLALMQAASCAAATPGHFAQYLGTRTPGALARVVSQRRRDIWAQFLTEAGSIRPLGGPRWRLTNRVMRKDALSIWSTLRQAGYRRGIVYADPPYSKDHYSRYYHVLETLVRYDYPTATGKGRYRPDRFVTPFSLKREVAGSFDQLARGVASTGSALILSYPSNGLLTSCADVDLVSILRSHFRRVDLALRRPTIHSTLGARHGEATSHVDEMVYVARVD